MIQLQNFIPFKSKTCIEVNHTQNKKKYQFFVDKISYAKINDSFMAKYDENYLIK